MPRPESAGAGQEIVFPHAVETLPVFSPKRGPGLLEIPEPGHERGVVIRAEIVPIFHHEQAFRGFGYLLHGRQHAVRKDILADPGIGGIHRTLGTDGVQKEKAAFRKAAVHYLHERAVVLLAHVLEHAQGNDVVEFSPHFPVVLQAQFDRQSFAHFPAKLRLFPGNRDARHPRAVSLGREFGEAAPAAADVEHVLPRLKPQLAANEVELGFLRLVQGPGLGLAAPIAAGVGHALI